MNTTMNTFSTKDQRHAAWLLLNSIPLLLDDHGKVLVTQDFTDKKYPKYIQFLQREVCEKLVADFQNYQAPCDAHTFCDILYGKVKPLFL